MHTGRAEPGDGEWGALWTTWRRIYGVLGSTPPLHMGGNGDPERKSDVPKVTQGAKDSELELEPGLENSVECLGPLCSLKGQEAWGGLGMF